MDGTSKWQCVTFFDRSGRRLVVERELGRAKIPRMG